MMPEKEISKSYFFILTIHGQSGLNTEISSFLTIHGQIGLKTEKTKPDGLGMSFKG